MLLSALDPALLIYEYRDWQARASHCFSRFEALTLHLEVTRQYDQKIVMSCRLVDLMYYFFPWNENWRGVSALRDFVQSIFQELQRVGCYIEDYTDAKATGEVSLEPTGIVCQCIEAPEVIDAWKQLLCGCVDDTVLTKFDPQIATWETASLRKHSDAMTLAIHNSDTGAQVYCLPLVWDDDSWAMQLVTQEWWPNLQRCVELHFRTNPGMRNYPGVRERPIPFECIDAGSLGIGVVSPYLGVGFSCKRWYN